MCVTPFSHLPSPLVFFPCIYFFCYSETWSHQTPMSFIEGAWNLVPWLCFHVLFFLKLAYPFLLLPHRTFQFPLIIGLLTIVVQVSNNKMNPLLYKQSIFYFYFYTGNSIWTRNFSSTVPFQDYIFMCAFKPEKLLSSILFLILIHFFFKKSNFVWWQLLLKVTPL